MWCCPKCGRSFKRTNQSHYCSAAPQTIEAYITQQEQAIQGRLLALHQLISGALPDAKQRIMWHMPTYSKDEIIVQFSACKAHVSLYVGEPAIAHFAQDLRAYECKKSAVYLPYDKPLPEACIVKLVQWCDAH